MDEDEFCQSVQTLINNKFIEVCINDDGIYKATLNWENVMYFKDMKFKEVVNDKMFDLVPMEVVTWKNGMTDDEIRYEIARLTDMLSKRKTKLPKKKEPYDCTHILELVKQGMKEKNPNDFDSQIDQLKDKIISKSMSESEAKKHMENLKKKIMSSDDLTLFDKIEYYKKIEALLEHTLPF